MSLRILKSRPAAVFALAVLMAAGVWLLREPAGALTLASPDGGVQTPDLQVVPLGNTAYGPVFCLVSPTLQSLCIYQVRSSNGELTLLAARAFDGDIQLRQFNTAAPLPDAVAAMLQAARGKRTDAIGIAGPNEPAGGW